MGDHAVNEWQPPSDENGHHSLMPISCRKCNLFQRLRREASAYPRRVLNTQGQRGVRHAPHAPLDVYS